MISFAVLHELTAVVPLIGIFFAAKYAGVGERLVTMMKRDSPAVPESETSTGGGSWLSIKTKEYLDEGEAWASRVGRRYGWWGYRKGAAPDAVAKAEVEGHLAGDVANAVFAYAVSNYA